VRSKLVLNPASLNHVKEELRRLVKQAEAEFELSMQQGSDPGNLSSSIARLREADGVFRLIELGDAAQLAHELAELLEANEHEDQRTLEIVGRSFFLLGRYPEFLSGHRRAVADLLIEDINAVRTVRKLEPFPESHFAVSRINVGVGCPGETQPMSGEDIDELIRRLRHLYQVGLLGVLKGRSDPVHLRLMQRAADRMYRLAGGGSGAEFWWLLEGVLEGVATGQLRMNLARNRLLCSADRQFKAVIQNPDTRSDLGIGESLKRDFLWLIAKCPHGKRIATLRETFGLDGVAVTDKELAEERRLLMGPSADAIDSVVRVLKGDLHKVKEDLERSAEAGSTSITDLRSVREILDRVASILRGAGLRTSADTLDRQGQMIATCLDTGTQLQRQDLLAIADAVLYVETTLSGLARAQGMARGFREQQDATRSTVMVREIFDDAKHSMFQSARAALEDVKRAVTSFVESGYSASSLANTGREFSAVKGSLAILEHERAADIASRTGEAVARFVDRGGAQSREELAEALADVLICLEYYVASLENDEEPDAMMLKIAEDSLRLFEQQVAEAS